MGFWGWVIGDGFFFRAERGGGGEGGAGAWGTGSVVTEMSGAPRKERRRERAPRLPAGSSSPRKGADECMYGPAHAEFKWKMQNGTHTHTRAHTHTHTHTNIYIYIYVYIYIYTHTHTHTHAVVHPKPAGLIAVRLIGLARTYFRGLLMRFCVRLAGQCG